MLLLSLDSMGLINFMASEICWPEPEKGPEKHIRNKMIRTSFINVNMVVWNWADLVNHCKDARYNVESKKFHRPHSLGNSLLEVISLR